MKTSAYSKMYLVLPSIYDKVLKSIDEKDKKVLEQLNVDKENNTSRPAAKYLDEIANTELQENNPPQTEFIDPETINEPEQTFGESEAMTTSPEDNKTTPEIGEVVNPLKTDCGQPDVQDKFISIIQPSLKRKRNVKPKLIIPSIIKKNPQIQKIQAADINMPNIVRPNVSYPTNVAPMKDIPRNFVCNFCGKRFKSTYHLNRHVAAIHKNLVQLSDPTLPQNNTDPSELVSSLKPVVPQPGTSKSNFQNWQDPQPINTKPRKRSSTEAKLNYAPRPSKYRANNNDEYDEW